MSRITVLYNACCKVLQFYVNDQYTASKETYHILCNVTLKDSPHQSTILEWIQIKYSTPFQAHLKQREKKWFVLSKRRKSQRVSNKKKKRQTAPLAGSLWATDNRQ